MNAANTGGRRWRRRLANLLILGGLLVILYPVGTWAVTWWEQRALGRELVESHPELSVSPGSLLEEDGLVYMTEDLEETAAEQQAVKAAGREVERQLLLDTFATAAADFSASLEGKGTVPLGRLTIPSIGVDVIIVEGTGRGDLREGPGHWPETPLPGGGGNFVVSGHRTTYGGPFFNLDKLVVGDVIELALPYVAARYEVTRSVIVFPNEVDVVAQRGVEELSLTTCHPIYSARQRLVIQARLVAFKLLTGEAAGPGA
ncbi:MAG: sortase [Thermoleophilia bacterium]